MGILKNIKRYCERRRLKKAERRFGPNTRLLCGSEKVIVGEHTYGKPRILMHHEGNTLRIGKFCSIAGDVTFLMSGMHHHECVSTYPWYNPFKGFRRWDSTGIDPALWCDRPSGDTVVGNDVWLGQGAFVLPGVRIGNGAVIGAQTVVSKDVPPYAVVVGSPMRILRLRFSEEQVAALQEIRWWDWSEEKIQRFLPLIHSSDIDAFIAAARAEHADHADA